MDAPRYVEFAPRAALRDFVHCLWRFSAPADSAPQPIAPDGRPELIVHLAEPYWEIAASSEARQCGLIFAGQLTEPLTLVARKPIHVVGVRFHPWAARAFLGLHADAATSRRINLVSLHGGIAADMLCGAREDPSRAATLAEDYVAARLAGARIDHDVRAAVNAIMAGEEVAPPRDVSERQWQRRFKAEVGVSPRALQSVLRFRRVFDEIEQERPHGWVEAALAAGYFDQPQMARDFRRYLGMSARQWAQQKVGLATMLTAPETYKKRPRE